MSNSSCPLPPLMVLPFKDKTGTRNTSVTVGSSVM